MYAPASPPATASVKAAAPPAARTTLRAWLLSIDFAISLATTQVAFVALQTTRYVLFMIFLNEYTANYLLKARNNRSQLPVHIQPRHKNFFRR
ncbi:hypothetical protein D9M68_385360 [compost metagenome]